MLLRCLKSLIYNSVAELRLITILYGKKSLSCSTVYRILRTFASENPEIAEKMAKQGKDVKPSDYEELLKKVSELESKFKQSLSMCSFEFL